MSEQAQGTGTGAAPQGGGAASQGGTSGNPFNRPQPAAPDRVAGHSPALDARRQGQQQLPAQQGGDGGGQQQQQRPVAPQTVNIDGVEWSHDQLKAAVARQIEFDAKKAALPQDPRGYELKLPADFKAPEGVRFELDPNSAELQHFRQVAHAHGLDQNAFSAALGAYAATKIGEQTQIATARNAEMAKLGSAGNQRIDAIGTWLRARAGQKADVIVSQLKTYPHSGMVEMFEDVMRSVSNQGAAPYSQSGRSHEEPNPGRIPGYENMSYAQRRAAQDAQARGGR